jgi:hypothetical protein
MWIQIRTVITLHIQMKYRTVLVSKTRNHTYLVVNRFTKLPRKPYYVILLGLPYPVIYLQKKFKNLKSVVGSGSRSGRIGMKRMPIHNTENHPPSYVPGLTI